MNRVLFAMILIPALYGCGPGYRWVNSEFSPEEMEDRFVMDKGACIREADQTYPDPYPVQDPDEAYYECMASTTRRETYRVKTDDGRTEYRTVTASGDPYLCTPSREDREQYRNYERELQSQRASQSQHVNSCLRLMGWDRIPVEQ